MYGRSSALGSDLRGRTPATLPQPEVPCLAGTYAPFVAEPIHLDYYGFANGIVERFSAILLVRTSSKGEAFVRA